MSKRDEEEDLRGLSSGVVDSAASVWSDVEVVEAVELDEEEGDEEAEDGGLEDEGVARKRADTRAIEFLGMD